MLCALLVRVSMLRPSLSLVVSFTSPLRVQISGLTPATLRRMMTTVTTATALRREVCALFYLALFYCCCTSMCVTATLTGAVEEPTDSYFEMPDLKLSVEISCADSDNPLKWRFPGQKEWNTCASSQGGSENHTVSSTAEYGVDLLYPPGEDPSHVDESPCPSAKLMYSAVKCNTYCNSSTLDATAFTMEYSTNNESGVYKKWLEYNKTSQNPSESAASSTQGVCPFKTITLKAPEGVDSGAPEATAAVTSTAQVPAVETPAAKQSSGSSSSAASGASSSGQSIGQGTSPADSPAGNASQLPPGEGAGQTDASGTTQTPSATPASGNGGASSAATAGAASQSGKPTHTQETNNSATTGAQGPGTSDSSAIATAWVHT
ncbi:mucin-like glycoprotein, putative, partial [Trypanosoma cruzi marinkellei]